MNREFDAQCAAALGWTVIQSDCYTPTGREWCGTSPDRQGGWDGFGRTYIPWYSSKPLDAALLEDEIERRGLQPGYISALSELVDPNDSFWSDDWQPRWLLIRATPEQKARAFLEVIK